MNPMEKSLEPTKFSTRLRNALKKMAINSTLEDVVKLYAQDSDGFCRNFLRLPNVGVATLEELLVFLDANAFTNDVVGRITTISRRDAAGYRAAIDRVLTHVDTMSADYQRLRDVQEALKSSTIIIEQHDDSRPNFHG